jgi:AraC family transcriptional regulator, arabinose operon regulatory protein
MDLRVTRALQEIERRYGEPLDVKTLAAESGLSRSRFAHLFRAEVGMSPMRHLQAVRLIRARGLVERADISINEVMIQVGYHDPSHFARDFRRYHGVSPRDLRVTSRRRRSAP